ncbi:MAG TPA: acyl-CoA dehydrogenase family protein [Myxococcota bacterium]|jgi:isovaleryl-CoA dehydrogenase|nr:acyl-CoA dehydrogenase family protein [Myxococcota bacterium]
MADSTSDASTGWRSFDLFAPTPEHALLAQTLREFVAREVEPQAAAHDRDERFNHALFRRAGELGLLGVILPEEHGGSGLDAVAAVQLCEALSTSDPGFALSVLAHAVLFAQNLSVNGNELQKKSILSDAASGARIGGLCMTEPEVGTDVLAMHTKARREGDHYVLDGRKTFITNGGIDEKTLGDVFIVYAATSPRHISSFLVEKGMPGFSLGQKWKDKLGMRASFTAELVFDGVRVPVSNRLGAEGEGTEHMMRNLEIERLTLAAMSVGIAQRCLEVMVAYANERKSFGKPIREHGQIQRYIAETFAEYRAARCYVYDTARRLDLRATGQRVDADGTKLFASQMGKRAADAAIQVLGGYGYMGEYVVSRLWRDAKLLEIGGGTLEAHHKNLAKDLTREPARLRG